MECGVVVRLHVKQVGMPSVNRILSFCFYGLFIIQNFQSFCWLFVVQSGGSSDSGGSSVAPIAGAIIGVVIVIALVIVVILIVYYR